MNPDTEILYNTMRAILEKLNVIEEAMKENAVWAEGQGVTLVEIAEHAKISVSHLRKQPWLLPFEEPQYGKKPYSYSRHQLIEHEKLIQEKGLKEVRRIWSDRVRAERLASGDFRRKERS